MSRTATFEVYRDSAGEWRWRLVASNGNIIADSGEGYSSKQGAERGIESVKRNA
ncbi:MAG: HVO_2922 family protein, partial [Haloarculaceae archaeon]